MLAEDPKLALRLLHVLSERLRETHEQLHAIASERARTRLARLILRHAPSDAKLSHQVLSRMAGITYEESVRILRGWSEAGLLRYERGGEITVLDAPCLARLGEGLEL